MEHVMVGAIVLGFSPSRPSILVPRTSARVCHPSRTPTRQTEPLPPVGLAAA